ncbi:MAG: GIY-YIG nuclease family protein [Candidatus Rokubacteria bacterium]|nr:GIY-YIG nuclease family protein [Candidatus Rokubacteria bacterium]
MKLFIPHGDAKRLRTGEVSNWTGKALAAPRTDVDELLAREELENSGVYFLFGSDPNTGDPLAYIGEAEIVRDRLKQHRSKDFWVWVVVFVSKDENLTKAHIRYLENRLIEEAKKIGRYRLENSNITTAKLPESDREDMEVFLSRIQQMLPVLGSDLLTPITGSAKPTSKAPILYCKNKGAVAKGQRTETGFAVFAGSTAVLKERPSAAPRHPIVLRLRQKLIEDGTLVERAGFYVFQRDTEFSSPSAAAAVIHGGGAAGPIAWKDEKGRTLKELEGD